MALFMFILRTIHPIHVLSAWVNNELILTKVAVRYFKLVFSLLSIILLSYLDSPCFVYTPLITLLYIIIIGLNKALFLQAKAGLVMGPLRPSACQSATLLGCLVHGW